VWQFLHCSEGKEGPWSHKVCFCTVRWAPVKPLWQEGPKGTKWIWSGKEFHDLKKPDFFIKAYNNITIESKLIKATRIRHYDRCCLQVTWVLILLNYQLHLTDTPMEVELLLQALRKSAALVITSSGYFVKDVGQMTWIQLMHASWNTGGNKFGLSDMKTHRGFKWEIFI